MAILLETIGDRQWCDTQSDSELAHSIAAQPPRAAEDAIRALNQMYRAGAGSDFHLDPVNMVPINPVGELLDNSFDAIRGARPRLSAAEIERVISWIRSHQSAA